MTNPTEKDIIVAGKIGSSCIWDNDEGDYGLNTYEAAQLIAEHVQAETAELAEALERADEHFARSCDKQSQQRREIHETLSKHRRSRDEV